MILSILKGIGIVLLILLTIIIFILLLVLFSPNRYHFFGKYDEEPEGKASIKWAPVLLKVTVTYHNKQLEYVVRLLGGVVMTNTNEKISWLGRKFFSFEDKAEEDEKQSSFDVNEEINDEAFDVHEHEYKEYDSSDREKKITNVGKQVDSKHFSKKRRKKRKTFFGYLKEKVSLLRKKIQNFVNTLKKINHKKEALGKIYHSKRFEQAKRDLKLYGGELFRIVKPDQLEGNVRFGLSDPAATGYILGIVAMMLPFYQGFLTVEPDFTQQILKGFLQGKGKIRLIFVVKLAIKVILNKNLIKVTKKVQSILET